MTSIPNALVLGGIIIGWLVTVPATSQQSVDSIEYDITSVIEENEITITYDLYSTEKGLLFQVTPFYEDKLGNQHTITEYVRGSWGDTITAGKQKKVFWNHYRTFPLGYKETIEIGLAVSVIAPKPTLSLKKKRYRRGSGWQLPLRGTAPYRYQVIDTNRLVYYRGELANRSAEVKLPVKLPLRKNYQIRVEDSEGNVAYTSAFTAKRRFPIGLMIGVPVAAVGTVLYFILQKDYLPEPYEKSGQ